MKTFPAVLVTGPRQSGKTTLLKKEHGRTHRFVSLEDADVRDRALADPNGFFGQHEPPLILDEIQYVPELMSYVKTRIDENRQAGQWFLTGAQNFSLIHNVSQSLAGRVAVLTLLPFAMDEACEVPGLARSMDTILKGFFQTGKIHAIAGPGKRISLIN